MITNYKNLQMKKRVYILLLGICMVWTGCRTDAEDIIPSQDEEVSTDNSAQTRESIKGFYLLNEGNMGSNKCTLDFYDATTGIYTRNIYAEVNPSVVKELGDVGNDLQVYDGKLWAVVNCSHFVEVMDAGTAEHITQISIPNCRYICFDGEYAYVSSYAGPVQIDPNARLGYVAKIDIKSLQVVDTCTVGYQPDELVVSDGRIYVANSGGYRVPNYDRTVSVIDIASFRVVETIDVAINLHRMEVDKRGYVWVSSRGDYYGRGSKTFVIDTKGNEVCDSFEVANSEMTISGDSLYIIGSEWSYVSNSWRVTYKIIDTEKRQVVSENFIADGTDSRIRMPYGVAVNRYAGELYITDAGNYVSPGTLYCFSLDGVLKWSVRTGDIPAHFAFVSTPWHKPNKEEKIEE
jgi:DNA-binding beta-propeller fold protein YncE